MDDRILGYADEISVKPGGRIRFMVSAPGPGPYRAELVRMRCGDDQPAGPGFCETSVPCEFAGSYPARRQAISAGSWIDVPDPERFALSTFTLQALVWPTTPKRGVQAIMGTWNDEAARGYALAIDARGALPLVVGDGSGEPIWYSTGTPLLDRHWTLIAASVDAENGRVLLYQLPRYEYAQNAEVEVAHGHRAAIAAGDRFRLAAWHGAAGPAAHYNGKLEAPRVAAEALERATILELADAAFPEEQSDSLVGAWDFSREISGTRVVDVGPHHLDGQTQNLPTRAVKGALWDGSEHRFIHKPHHYAAIHFHDDDLYDCGWDSDFSFDVPSDFKSGAYAAKLTQDELEEYIPFYVRPLRGKATARLALLIPTASYYAYANWHTWMEWDFIELVTGNFVVADRTGVFLQEHPELGCSMYDTHTDGSGVCYSSRLRPIPNMRPRQWQWQWNADTHITDWLEAKGFDYDVITDDDLDAEGISLIESYDCVMTCTHPEYYSLAMMEALQSYKAQGGRLMYMGANGFYWRVSYHPDLPGVIEMRRAEGGMRGWIAEPGEYYHSFSGELGGLWQRNGIAPQQIAGTGFTAQGFDMSAPYHRNPESHDPRAAFIFEGLRDDEVIGDFGLFGGGAAGLEIDRADPLHGTPPHTLVVATADEFSSAYHWVVEEYTHAHSAIDGDTCPWIRSDMVFFETPRGGAVFSSSSIAWSGSLCHNDYDNNVSRITENVLRRFLDPTPFDVPKAAALGA